MAVAKTTTRIAHKNTVAQNVDPEYRLYQHPVCERNVPFVLIILSGWGEGREDEFNAIHKSDCVAIKTLRNIHPYRWRTLKAHGEWVGLPKNTDMGNGEVGNNAMGCGKIVAQRATLVDKAIADGSMSKGQGWLYAKEAWVYGGTLHLLGLLSDGGVHSRYDQLRYIFKTAADQQCKKIRFHVLLDGRDVNEGTSIHFVEQLEKDLDELRKWGCDARIASGGGRMFVTMDHWNTDWRIVRRGWYAHVLGDSPNKYESAVEAITDLKKKDPHCNDQYLPPFVIIKKSDGKPWGTIEEGDVVINFNFRADRMIQISQAFVDENFDKFDRIYWPNVRYVALMQYDLKAKIPIHYLVKPPQFHKLAGKYLSANGVRTFAITESQKMGHITFNWNGNNSGKTHEVNDTWHEVQSENVRYEYEPEMRAATIGNVANDALLSGKYDFVRVMFANGDFVGHTNDFEATKRACVAVDEGIKLICSAVELCGGIYMIVGDHGNCEDMVQRDVEGNPQLDGCGNPFRKPCHSLHEVPCGIGGPGLHPNARFRDNLRNAGLANVTATYMNLLGFEAPHCYEPSLLTFDYNPWAFTGVHEDHKPHMDDQRALIKR